MTTLTNSEGKVFTYTNELIEAILLQLNSSNNYYTSGDDDILFIKIGSNRVLVLDYTYNIKRNIFPNHTIIENSLNNYDLEFIVNNTSNEYDLQSVYNGNGFLGTITGLPQVFLAIYDTWISSHTYTGSENIDITVNQISLKFHIKVNDGMVFKYNVKFVFWSTCWDIRFFILQNIVHGSQPIAIFNEAGNLLTNVSLTGSENINITNNGISLTYPQKIIMSHF